MSDLTLENRRSLPEPLRVLIEAHPRSGWTDDPGFDGLIRFWLDRHLMFRRLLADMTAATESLIDGNTDPQGYAALLSRYGGIFVNQLHEHHMIEDSHYFPRLSKRDPRIERGFAMLDADHVALDGHIGHFVGAANSVLQAMPGQSFQTADAGHFRETLAGMERLLNRHLTDEEDLVVPVILKFGTAGLG